MIDEDSPVGSDIKDSMLNYIEKRDRASVILDARYSECDKDGHLSPDEKNNYCGHCYRRLNYIVESGNKNRSNAGFSLHKTITGGAGIKKRAKEINRQRTFDHMDGLRKIITEYDL